MTDPGVLVRSTRGAGARLLAVLLLALGALAFAATPAGAATHDVSITDTAFTPPTLEVALDDTVVWTNDGTTTHDVSADDGSFQSGPVSPGLTFTHESFDTEGTYVYRSTTDTDLTGTIVVTGAAIGSAQSADAFTATGAPAVPEQPVATPEQFAYTGAAESIALAVLGTVVLLFGWAVITGFGSPLGRAEPWRILALANPRRAGFTDELMPRGRWRRVPRRSTQANLLPAHAHSARPVGAPVSRATRHRRARRAAR